MDEQAYRELYREVNHRQCPYEKAILANHCRCSQAQKLLLAEREAVRCENQASHERCQAFLDALRQAMRFALKTDQTQRLPHARAMRLQVGGLRGLHRALHDAPPPPIIEEIDGLLTSALARWKKLEAFPYQSILPEVAAWEGRKPKGRRRRR